MKPPSAPITPATAPKAVAQPLGARVTFRLTGSEAAKFGLLDRWRAAVERRRQREAQKRAALVQFAETVSSLLAKAAAAQWSQRQLAAKIGIPETTFRRIKNQKVKPLVWLPKVEAALASLNGTY